MHNRSLLIVHAIMLTSSAAVLVCESDVPAASRRGYLGLVQVLSCERLSRDQLLHHCGMGLSVPMVVRPLRHGAECADRGEEVVAVRGNVVVCSSQCKYNPS